MALAAPVELGTLVPTVIDAASIEEVLANAERNFKLAAQRVFSLVSLGRKMGENQ